MVKVNIETQATKEKKGRDDDDMTMRNLREKLMR